MRNARNINPILLLIPKPKPKPVVKAQSLKPSSSQISENEASPRKQDPLKRKKGLRGPRRLIWVSPWDSASDHIVTLKDLQLDDLVDDQIQHQDTMVSITLSSQQLVGFGCSVNGRIMTSFDAKCRNCLGTYRKEIDTSFQVWILQSSRKKHENQMPEIGGDDPDAIYVERGGQASLDSLIQETIRLRSGGNGTCSESCENTQPTEISKLHDNDNDNVIAVIGKEHIPSVDPRWAKLLELKKGNLNSSA